MACNNTKYTFLSVGSVCTSVLLWPMVLLLTYSKCREYQTLFIGSKKRRKKNVPWSNRTWQSLDILFQRTRLRVNEHCTFLNMAQYLVAWLRLPFSREVVIWTVPGYTFIERWKTFDAKIWSKKNMHTQWEKEKRWVIEKYMPNWWNSDEVKRLVFFLLLLFWTVCYFILLKWAKINRIHAMKVLSIY